ACRMSQCVNCADSTALTLAIMHDMQLFDGPMPLLSSDCRKRVVLLKLNEVCVRLMVRAAGTSSEPITVVT
ncbi:hypothetical protein JOQ06_000418, partial [Pogonophryne albipinna]